MEILKLLQTISILLTMIGCGLAAYGSRLYSKSEDDKKKQSRGLVIAIVGFIITIISIVILLTKIFF